MWRRLFARLAWGAPDAPRTPRARAAELLLRALSDPDVRYSRLLRDWPDIRQDPLLREGAYLLARLRHRLDDRLDQERIASHLVRLNDLLNRLRDEGASSPPESSVGVVEDEPLEELLEPFSFEVRDAGARHL